MRLSILMLSLVLAVPAAADPPGHGGRSGGYRTSQRAPVFPGDAEVASIHRTLNDLEVLADAARSPTIARELRERIARIRQDLRGLDDARFQLADEAASFEQELMTCERRERRERNRPPVIVQPPEPPPPMPVNGAELNGIITALNDAAFSREKLAILRSASASRWFTVDQVVRIMHTFDFGRDKVEAAAMLHEAVVDRENWYQVYSALTFGSDQRKLRERVGE